MRTTYDVIVVGGGPGGSTVANLLARAGRHVLLLEKAIFPRYQIGESLLLATWDIFEALGVRRRIENAGFERKPGATFVWGREERPWSVYFAELDGRRADSRNVERARFDQILIERAAEVGAVVRFGAKVNALLREGERVVGVEAEIDGERRRLRARYVVDASGRASSLTRHLARRSCPDDFKGAALWTYFKGAKPLPPPNTGNILYAMFAWGWFWVIPLSNGITSVGVVMNPPKFKETVARVSGREELYGAAIAACPIVSDMISGAERIDELHTCADYSLDSDRYHGPGFLLVGDAACFIDPILSTGVHLAMRGGQLAGLALNTAFEEASEAPLATFEDLYRQEYRRLLAVSRQQYELNKDRAERFWGAHRIIEPSMENPSFEADRLAFISLIAGIGDDRERVLDAQRKDREDMFMKYGPGRFDAPEFADARLSIATGELKVRRGYRVGALKRLTFARAKVVEDARGSGTPLKPADVELLGLCDGRRSVADVTERYRRRYDLAPVYEPHLRRSLGYWVDKGVLLSSDSAAPAAPAASLF